MTGSNGVLQDSDARIGARWAREVVAVSPGEIGFRDVPLRLPHEREVLVRMLFSSISHGTERRQLGTPTRKRTWDPTRRIYVGASDHSPGDFPKALGYEAVGRVIASGPRSDLPIGTLLVVDAPHSDYALISLDRDAHMRIDHRGQPLERFTFCVRARVALGAIHDARLVIGDDVAIVGLGVVGLLCLQMALLSGAHRVYCIDHHVGRVKLAERLGGIGIVADDAAMQVKDLSKSTGIDVAIEASGSASGLHEAIRCCRIGGRVITVGTYAGEAAGLRLGDEWSKNRITLLSSMTANGCPPREATLWDRERLSATALRLIAEDRLRLDELITHRVPFDAASHAYSLLQSAVEPVQILLVHDER